MCESVCAAYFYLVNFVVLFVCCFDVVIFFWDGVSFCSLVFFSGLGGCFIGIWFFVVVVCSKSQGLNLSRVSHATPDKLAH